MESKTEFAVFCIENVAQKLNMDAASVYDIFSQKTGILKDYILPNYDVLHTQGKEYIMTT